MTMQQPPSPGWTAHDGQTYSGQPPAGWRRASDGRWWPPQQAQELYLKPKRGGIGKVFIMFGVFVLLLGSCGFAVVVLAAAGDGDEIPQAFSAEDTTTTLIDDADQDAVDPAADAEGEADREIVGGDEADDYVSCAFAGEDEVTIEVVNQSPKTSTYWLTVGFFEGGERLGDEVAFINSLRPGERSIEEHFMFDRLGSECEVIEVERFASESDEGEMAEVSACEVGGADVLGDITASLSATNGTPGASDYAIDVAFVDETGTRVGHGSAFIEAVRPGETAPSDVLTTLDARDGLVCEVVSVDRTTSL